MKHHPDKVNHLGDDIRKAAEERFAKLNESYERIKKARGIN
jgi:DnaJ like chaperone protein